MQLNACINIYGVGWIDHRYRSLAPAPPPAPHRAAPRAEPLDDDRQPTDDHDTTADPIAVCCAVRNYLINRFEFFATCLLLITWASSNRAARLVLEHSVLAVKWISIQNISRYIRKLYINYNVHCSVAGNVLIIFRIIVTHDWDTDIE